MATSKLTDFFKKHDSKANTVYAITASGYSTVMFIQKILVNALGALSGPATIAIFSLMLFHIFLDKYLFDLIEKLFRRFKKDFYLSLEDREIIKFLILLVIAVVCVSLGQYIIPLALLLFTAGYFLNYTLQLGKLGETLQKFFYVDPKRGRLHLFKGFLEFDLDGIKGSLSTHQMRMLKLGAFLSVIFAVAMIAIAAKWVLPLIKGIALIGTVANPLVGIIILSIIVGGFIVGYGIIYGFFVARGWADLIQYHAYLQKKYKQSGWFFSGVFSWQAVCEFKDNVKKGIADYWKNFVTEISGKSFFSAMGLFFKKIFFLGWKWTRVLFSGLCFIGMYYGIDQGGREISKLLKPEVGTAVTVAGYAAQAPMMLESAAKTVLPDKDTPVPGTSVHPLTQLRITFYSIVNGLRQALVPNGGERAANKIEMLTVTSMLGASFIAVRKSAEQNFLIANKENEATKKLLLSSAGAVAVTSTTTATTSATVTSAAATSTTAKLSS